jgi:alanyl-tRNA synthetase
VAEVVDRDANGLKSLALAIAALGSSAVLVSKSQPCLVVAARGASSTATFDASAVIKALIARFGGKGGGRPEMAQAGGIDGDPAEVVVAAVNLF